MAKWTNVTRGAGRLLVSVLLAGASVLAGLTATASYGAGDGPKPFGLTCHATEHVRFCPGDVNHRVATFDGVPLDVNVVLPAAPRYDGKPDASYPLVVELHGWAGAKLGLDDDAGGFNEQRGGQYAFLPTPRSLAEHGMAVLTYSSRGFGDSCGSPASRADAACAEGWTHLADVRYEAHDTQFLAGLLADSGLVDAQRVGVIGSSYGGLQALELSTLGDHTVMPSGDVAPWRSPKKNLPMHLASVTALDTASSLVDALVPNGRWRDDPAGRSPSEVDPVGVPKMSWNTGLYGAGQAAGYIAPPGIDPSGDLTTSFLRLAVGDPSADPVAIDSLNETAQWHEAAGLDARDAAPPPTLLVYGWSDSLFPVDQALRWVYREHAAHPSAVIGQMYTDIGHPPAPNKPADRKRVVSRVTAWHQRYLLDESSRSVVHGVEAWLHTCPMSSPSTGPVHAPSWTALHPQSVELSGAGGDVVGNAADAASARATDPVAGDGICAAQPVLPPAAGTVVDTWPVKKALTLLGAPTVRTTLQVTDAEAQAPYVTGPAVGTQLDARLWDVAPDGSALLLTRLLYRPRVSGPQRFQLHPIGYRVAAGHQLALELRGSDAPYGRPSNEPFTINVGKLRLSLPIG